MMKECHNHCDSGIIIVRMSSPQYGGFPPKIKGPILTFCLMHAYINIPMLDAARWSLQVQVSLKLQTSHCHKVGAKPTFLVLIGQAHCILLEKKRTR